MKKIICIITHISCLILPVSCLTNLQPLVTNKNIIAEDRIIGDWQSGKGAFQIKRLMDVVKPNDLKNFRSGARFLTAIANNDPTYYKKTYAINFEKNGIRYELIGSLTKIKDDLFIEISPGIITDPERTDGSSYELTFYYLPTFTIAKLIIKDNKSLDIQFLDGDFIKEQIDAGNMRIKHEKDNLFNSFVVTASSSELIQFFEKYGKNDRLFSPKNSITLNRKG